MFWALCGQSSDQYRTRFLPSELAHCLTRMAQSDQGQDGRTAGRLCNPEGASAQGWCWVRLGAQQELRQTQFLHPSSQLPLFTGLGMAFPSGRSDKTSFLEGGITVHTPKWGTAMQSWGLGPWAETESDPSPSSAPQPVRFWASHFVCLWALPSLDPDPARVPGAVLICTLHMKLREGH